MNQRITPKPGEFYRHFKNRLYQIITIAAHSETGEIMVVYQALYGDYKTYVRPLEMFMSEVDHTKYPDIIQQYRFEKIKFKARDEQIKSSEKDIINNRIINNQTIDKQKKAESSITTTSKNNLIKFLDAETYEDKTGVLLEAMGQWEQSDLDAMYTSLSITGFGGDVKQQVKSLISFLEIQNKYEGGRLRDV